MVSVEWAQPKERASLAAARDEAAGGERAWVGVCKDCTENSVSQRPRGVCLCPLCSLSHAAASRIHNGHCNVLEEGCVVQVKNIPITVTQVRWALWLPTDFVRNHLSLFCSSVCCGNCLANVERLRHCICALYLPMPLLLRPSQGKCHTEHGGKIAAQIKLFFAQFGLGGGGGGVKWGMWSCGGAINSPLHCGTW